MSGNWFQFSTHVEAEYQQIHLDIGMGRADQERRKETGEVIRPGENLDAQHSIVLTKFKTRTEHRVNIGQTDQVRWYSTSTRVRSAAEFLGETTVQTKRCALNRPQRIDRLASMMSIFNIEPGEIIPSGTTLVDILKVDREEGRSFRRGRDVKHMENQTGYERKLAAESHFAPTRAITKDKRTKQNKNKGVKNINITHSKELEQEIPSSVDGKMISMDATQTATSLKISGQLKRLNVKTGEKKAMSINTSKGNEGVSFPLKVYQNSEFKDMSLEDIKFKATDDNNNGSETVTVGGADLDSSNTTRESDDVIQKDIHEAICATTTIPAVQRASHTSSAKASELMNTVERPEKQATAAVQTWDEDGQDEPNTLRKITHDSKDKSSTFNDITCEGKDDPQIQESSKLIGQKLKGILKYTNTPKTESTKPLECPSSVGKELKRILKPTRMNRFDLMEKPGFIDRYFLTWEKLAIIKSLKEQQVKRKTQQSYCGAEVCNEKEAGPKKTGNTHEDSSDSDNALAEDLPHDKEKGQSGKHDLPPYRLKSCHGPQKRLMTKANNFDDGDSDSDCAIAEDLPQDQDANRLPGKLEDGRDAISFSDNDSESDCAKAEDLPLDCEHNACSRKQVKQPVNKKDAADSKKSKRQVACKATLNRGTDDSNSTRTAQVQQHTSEQSPDSDDETFSENAQTISWSGSDSDCNLIEDLPFDHEDNALSRQQVKQPVNKKDAAHSKRSKRQDAGEATLHREIDDSNSTRTAQVQQYTSKQSPDSDDETFSENAQTISWSGSDSDCNLIEDLPFDHDISSQTEQLETPVKAKKDTRPNEIHLDGRHTHPNERNTRPNEKYTRHNKRDTQLDERHTHPNKRNTRHNERDTHPNIRHTQLDERHIHPNKRNTSSNERDTHPKERDTRPNERDTRQKERYTRPNERDTRQKERDTRPNERDTRPNERDTRQKERDTRPNERDTRQKERDTRPNERDTRQKERDTRPNERHRCLIEGDKCHNERSTRPNDRHTRHCDREMTILERISVKSKRRTKDTDLRSTVDTPGETGLYSRKVSQNLGRLFGRDELSEYLEPAFNPYHGLTVVDLRSQNPVDVYSQRCHRKRKNIYSTMYPSHHNETGHRAQREARPEVKRMIGLNLSRSHNTPHQGKLSRIMRSIRGKIKNLKETFCGCFT